MARGRFLPIEDPRDNLAKAHRSQLVRFAHSKGLTHITEEMPADDYLPDDPINRILGIRTILRQHGFTQIDIGAPLPLGANGRHVIPPPPKTGAAPPPSASGTVTLTEQQLAALVADAVAKATGKPARYRSKAEPRKRLVERPKSYINKLRDACKAAGIHMERRDRIPDLERKLTENDQDPSQFRQ